MKYYSNDVKMAIFYEKSQKSPSDWGRTYSCDKIKFSDEHSGATSAATFAVAVAAVSLLFFVTSDERQRRCFFSQKSGSTSALFFKQFSAAAATANKLLPRLFSI